MAAKKRTTSTTPDNRSEADKRDEARRQFVAQKKAQGVSAKEANTQFYVQTRVKELSAKGVKVDAAKRKELRQNYQSGNVKRAGFGVTPATGGGKTGTGGGKPASKTRVQVVPDRMASPRRNQVVPDRMKNPLRTRTGEEMSAYPAPAMRKLYADLQAKGSHRDTNVGATMFPVSERVKADKKLVDMGYDPKFMPERWKRTTPASGSSAKWKRK